MNWQEKGQLSSLAPFLLDKKEVITDNCTLRQLLHFANVHRLGSPLWLSWDLAAGLGLTLRYMQSPLSVWSPLMGESFVPLLRSSVFSDEVTRRYPVRQIVNFADASPAMDDLTRKQILVLSAAAFADGEPRWCSVPESLRHLFVFPGTSSCSPSCRIRRANEVGVLGLWASAVFLSRMTVAPDSQVLVHTPSSSMRVVNADQLYPSSFLSEKELECIILQSQ